MLESTPKLWIRIGILVTSAVTSVMSPCHSRDLWRLKVSHLVSPAMTKSLPITVRIARNPLVLALKMLMCVGSTGTRNALCVLSQTVINLWYVPSKNSCTSCCAKGHLHWGHTFFGPTKKARKTMSPWNFHFVKCPCTATKCSPYNYSSNDISLKINKQIYQVSLTVDRKIVQTCSSGWQHFLSLVRVSRILLFAVSRTMPCADGPYDIRKRKSENWWFCEVQFLT